MNRKAVIKSARITAMPRPMPDGMFDPMPEVMVILEDGSEHKLFSFLPDEISFRAEEFVGKTVEQACDMRHRRDVAYIRS